MVKVWGTSKTSPKWLAVRSRENRVVHEAMKGLNKKWRKWGAQWEMGAGGCREWGRDGPKM